MFTFSKQVIAIGMENLYIVMPAYNEQKNIQEVIEEWHPIVQKISNNSRLVIVNDGSKDSTYEKMLSLQEKFPLLIPLTKPNSGHGTTCLYAYKAAITEQASWIFQTDSDGQTDPNDFWQFWDKRDEYDFLIGNRKNRMDGSIRVFVTKILKLVIFIIFRLNIPDANTPFRLMKTSKLKVLLEKIPNDSFLANVFISVLAVHGNISRCTFPTISFKPRRGGVNSINLKHIMKIGIKAVSEFKDLKKVI